MINVLIVEDSPVMQEFLAHILTSDPDFNILGFASNGEEAIEAVQNLNPDIIAMDLHMPKLDGKEATAIIMEKKPTPIVIVTGSENAKDSVNSFSMFEAGALAIVKKPVSIDHPDFKIDVRELTRTLRLMSEVKVVKRINQKPKIHVSIIPETIKKVKLSSDIEIVAIGASTGGPNVIQKILQGLPQNFPVPLIIVQHISRGFSGGLVEWLKNSTGFPVKTAIHGEILIPGHAYFAPDNYHIGVENGSRIILSNHTTENGLKPSVSFLFRTIAQVYGPAAIGILLTGMGNDGAYELKLMKDHGAITFVQDKDSSIVHGMPGEAIKLNAATHVLSPDDMITALNSIFNNKSL